MVSFFLGAGTTFVAGFFQYYLSFLNHGIFGRMYYTGQSIYKLKLTQSIIDAFISAGLIEELVKLIVIYFYIYSQEDFKEIIEGVIYSISVALGFATFENYLYFIRASFIPGYAITVILMRAISATIGHALFTGFMGYYIGIAKYTQKKQLSLFLKGYLIAVVLHGIYDFVLMLGTSLAYVAIPILIFMFGILHQKIKKALNNFSKKIAFETQLAIQQGTPSKVCPYCRAENLYNAVFCINCQKKIINTQDLEQIQSPAPYNSQKEKILCPRCGKRSSTESNFCKFCGHKFFLIK